MSGRSNIHGLGQLSGGASSSTTTQVTSSSENFPGPGQVLGGAAKSSKPKLTDRFAEEHFEAAIKQLSVNSMSRLFGVLDGLTHQDISQLITPIAGVPLRTQARDVLIAYIGKKPDQATHQAIVKGLAIAGLHLAEENLKTHWTGEKSLDQKCVPDDINTIIGKGKLAWANLYKMFLSLGLEDFEIQLNRNVDTGNVNENARKIFGKWVMDQKPIIKDLMDALKKIENLNAAQELAKEWKIPLDSI